MAPTKAPDWLASIEQGLEESQNQRDARVEKLWARLDPTGEGELDLNGLQKGFRRIDHPMKNANGMIKGILQRLDTNKDGKIQYDEFRIFIEQAESQLLMLFRSIDHDNNGRLDKNELQAAFKKSGLTVPSRKLNGFFGDMDLNNDGFISFDEWRDFLIFMPAHDNTSPLHAVMSFYSSIVTITPEGDGIVSDDTLQGLGTRIESLVRTLFGTVFVLAGNPPGSKPRKESRPRADQSVAAAWQAPLGFHQPSRPGDAEDYRMKSRKKHHQQQREHTSDPPVLLDSGSPAPSIPASSPGFSSVPSPPASHMSATATFPAAAEGTQDMLPLLLPKPLPTTSTPTLTSEAIGDQSADRRGPSNSISSGTDSPVSSPTKQKGLTSFIPDPGYFLAGAIAGGVSRTATAPLDRLKVFLLVSTSTTKTSPATIVKAAKKSRIPILLRNWTKPIGDAVKEIHTQGGLRGFFAGNGLNVVKIMPETAIKFGSYEATKRAFANFEGHGDAKKISSYSKFAAGGIAGMVAQFAVYPLDTLKFRLQCETVKGGLTGNALIIATAKKMLADGGMRSAYRGITMGLIGMFPYSAIDMGTFEFLKNLYKEYNARLKGIHEEDAGPGNVATGIIGATSGAIGASAVYPLNVVRTRLQTQGTVMHKETYTGIMDATRRTIKNEGMRGLYKGLTPNLLKVAPALSITWVVYENAKKAMGLD